MKFFMASSRSTNSVESTVSRLATMLATFPIIVALFDTPITIHKKT